MPGTFREYADGKELFGDSFSPAEIEEWYQDEKEGYFNLGQFLHPGEGHRKGNYGYGALNRRYGFRHLPDTVRFEQVLAIGGAFGEELEPVVDRANHVTILEPSDGFIHERYQYVKPQANGKMEFPDASFDLVTCFGVLHHIPNVSFVIKEVSRCMKPGAWLLLREPIESMGNWDLPRPGLTRRERGIPFAIMLEIVRGAGLDIVRARRCMFAVTAKIQAVLTRYGGVYDTPWVVALDDHVSNLPVWPRQYHARNFIQKFRPLSVYLVARKPEGYLSHR